jgi:hypothetical protein
MAHLTVDVTIKFPNPASFLTPFIVLISAVFYALTGAISGAGFVLLYNLTSKFWPGVSATVAADPPTTEPSPGIGLI